MTFLLCHDTQKWKLLDLCIKFCLPFGKSCRIIKMISDDLCKICVKYLLYVSWRHFLPGRERPPAFISPKYVCNISLLNNFPVGIIILSLVTNWFIFWSSLCDKLCKWASGFKFSNVLWLSSSRAMNMKWILTLKHDVTDSITPHKHKEEKYHFNVFVLNKQK